MTTLDHTPPDLPIPPAVPGVLMVPPVAVSASAVRRDRTEKIALFRYQLIRAIPNSG